MKEVKVKVVLPFVSGDKSFDSGEHISMEEGLAYALAKKSVIEFDDEAQFKTIDKSKTAKATKAKAKKLEEAAKANSILKQSEIQNELNELYLAVVLKEAELNGEVLSDEEVFNEVESIQKRDALVSKKADGK